MHKPKINTDKAKKKNKAKRKWSIYRDEKSIGHKTINGRGIVGRLIDKHNG